MSGGSSLDRAVRVARSAEIEYETAEARILAARARGFDTSVRCGAAALSGDDVLADLAKKLSRAQRTLSRYRSRV